MSEAKKLTLWPYYLFQTFFQLLLWIPVFYAFQKTIGLNDVQIFKIQSWYFLIFVVFEIPTGYFSDRFGHQTCMKVGSFVLALSNLIPIVSPTFIGMFTHFATIALARSLLSGAGVAYMYEYLKNNQQTEIFKMVEGRARSFALIARTIGWSAIAPLMAIQLNLPYVLTAVFAFLAFVFSYVLPKLPQVEDVKGVSFFKDLSEIPSVLKKSPNLLLYIALGLGLFVLARICQINLFQPLLELKEFPLASFGIIMAVMTVFEAFGSGFSYKLGKKISDLNALYLMSSVICISFLLLVFGGKSVVVIGFFVFALAAGIAFPLQKQLVNSAIVNGQYRATLLSLESMIDRLVTAFVVSFLGGFIEAGKLLDYLLYSAVGAAIFITTIYILLIKRNPVS